jgi:hypothetical protein
MRLGTGITSHPHYSGSQAPRDDRWSYTTTWRSLRGWTQLSALDPDEFAPVGVVEEGWLGITDATLTDGYPDSFPGIGGVIRPFDFDLVQSGFRIRLVGSGILPIEPTPLIVFGAPNVAKPNAFGYGAWLFHDIFLFNVHLGPALGLAGQGYPPDDFGTYLDSVVTQPHVDGTPFTNELVWDASVGELSCYYNGSFSSSMVVEFPTDLAIEELWLGAQVDAHWCTPAHTPYNIDPVPSVSSRAAGTLFIESLGRPIFPPP